MPHSLEEERVSDAALQFAKKHKKSIAQRLTNPEIYTPEDHPVSVFMAGSPGAGKTEASLELLAKFGSPILRIDADELRAQCPGYTGSNSSLFQAAVSVLVDKVHDLALEQKQSFLLDGTLTHYERAEKNISRSLKKGRLVQILYVYQDPLLAWQFVLAREATEGRRIPAAQFIAQYFAARIVVNALKRRFGSEIRVDLLLKDNDGSHRLYKAGVDNIDNHIPEKYDQNDIERMLSPT